MHLLKKYPPINYWFLGVFALILSFVLAYFEHNVLINFLNIGGVGVAKTNTFVVSEILFIGVVKLLLF